MKVLYKSILAAFALVIIGASSFATETAEFGGIIDPSQGEYVIGTAPTAPTGAIKKPVPFNIYNATLVNNTFGIRVDRPLDMRLLNHAITTIKNLESQGRITAAERELLYKKVVKYTSKSICMYFVGDSWEPLGTTPSCKK